MFFGDLGDSWDGFLSLGVDVFGDVACGEDSWEVFGLEEFVDRDLSSFVDGEVVVFEDTVGLDAAGPDEDVVGVGLVVVGFDFFVGDFCYMSAETEFDLGVAYATLGKVGDVGV